jgi:ATP-dependent DNA helicase RecQ
MPNRLSRALRQLGVRSLRPGQRDVIDAVLVGRDTLAVMPTGSGKSLCHQVPAPCLDGPTIVVAALEEIPLRRHAPLPQRYVRPVR